MKRGLDWYKRDPRAIRDAIRAAKMSAVQAAVYNLAVDLIYEGAGETPNDPAYFAAHFGDISATKAKRAIAELVAMGKLFLVGDMLHQERAENEAKSRRDLSELRTEIGRRGGISSGKSRAKSSPATSENNDIAEANASSKTEPEKEKRREEGGVVGGTREHAPDPSFFRNVLVAAGYNQADVLPTHWMPPKAELEVVAWLTLPGMTEALAIRHVEESTRQRGRADGPRAFVRGLRALSAQAIAPPIPPPEPVPAPPQAASPEPHPGAPHARSPRPSRSDAKLDSFLRGATG